MIGDDYTVIDLPGVGRAMFVLPVVPEQAPQEVRAGIAARRVTMLEGRCPECGALRVMPNREQRRAMRRDKTPGSATWSVDVEHAPGCLAITDELLAAMKRWRAT